MPPVRIRSSPLMTQAQRNNLLRKVGGVGIGGLGAAGGAGSVKSRLGFKRGLPAGGVGMGMGARTGIKARLGPRGALGKISPGKLTDARQKINLNRSATGRIARKTNFSDARNKIQAARLRSSATAPGIGQAAQGIPHGATTLRSGEPLRNLIITTQNTPAQRGNLFQNAMSGLRQPEWGGGGGGYGGGMEPANMYSTFEPVLTRTISNNLSQPQRSMGRPSASVFDSPPSRYGGGMRSDYMDSRNDDYMDIDRPAAAAAAGLRMRSSMQSRLDRDPQFKVRVSNLQSSVTVEDVAELFSDVGDLLHAKSLGPGVAEAYYRTRADCLKAVETYHNRLLDARPMNVVFEDKQNIVSRSLGGSGLRSSSNVALKSAAGATSAIKLPKASSSSRINPDLSAIHKVLFQPASSSTVTKMLFKGGH